MFFTCSKSGSGGGADGVGFKEKVASIVLSTIKENPNAIVDAMGDGISKKRDETIQQIAKTVLERRDEVEKLSLVFGDRSAKKSIICFFDPLCPHCIEFQKAVAEMVSAKKSVCFKLLPIVVIGEDSLTLARLYVSAYRANQEKALKVVAAVSEVAGKAPINQKSIEESLKTAGMDPKDVKMKDQEVDKQLMSIGDLANNLKIPLVPAIFVTDGVAISALTSPSREALVQAVDSETSITDSAVGNKQDGGGISPLVSGQNGLSK
jgi:protein-disulfide isomerase